MQAEPAGDVLVLNSGPSTITYHLIDPGTGSRRAAGAVGPIGGSEPGQLRHYLFPRSADQPEHHPNSAPDLAQTRDLPDHESAMAAILATFQRTGPDLEGDAPLAVGHRVAHGGTRFTDPVLVDDAVAAHIEDLFPLSPQHNPANHAGIQLARTAFPTLPHVAAFDTGFHHTLPSHAHTYAVPTAWRDQFGVRRYGSHGISYRYVSQRAAALLGRDETDVNLIVLHLGDESSACAISGGESVETSTGLTPLEGLMTSTGSGAVDPSLAMYLKRVAGLDTAAVDSVLNHDSGLLGLSGKTDLRDVWTAADRGDPAARLAIDVYCHSIRKYIGAYYAVLGRVDAIVFTGVIGERASRTRAQALTGLGRLGIGVHRERNNAPGVSERFVSPTGAEVPVLVVPTDEAAEISAQVLGCLRPALACH